MPARSRLTAALIDALCDELRKGKPKRAAAAAVGIHRDTLNDWERKGRQAQSKRDEQLKLTPRERLLADAAARIELAIDEGESWLIDQIIETAQKGRPQWQAYATILERTRADIWQRKRTVDVTGGVKHTHTFDPSKLTDSELELLERMLEKAAPSEE